MVKKLSLIILALLIPAICFGTTIQENATGDVYLDTLKSKTSLATDSNGKIVDGGSPWTSYLPLVGGTLTGDLTIGSTTAGKNETINATIGAEIAPALVTANWNGDGTGNGFAAITGGVIQKNADGYGPVEANTGTIEVGASYIVTVTFSAFSAGTASIQVGSNPTIPPALTAATTYTLYITAYSTDKITIRGSNESRFTISAISVKKFTAGTGDLTVNGKLYVHSLNAYTLPLIGPEGNFIDDNQYVRYDPASHLLYVSNLYAGTFGVDMDMSINGYLTTSGVTALESVIVGDIAGAYSQLYPASLSSTESPFYMPDSCAFGVSTGAFLTHDNNAYLGSYAVDQGGKFFLGSSLEMSIYHDGDGHITNTTGDLYLPSIAFGTYTATPKANTGYITVKDSSGNPHKLAVCD